jgi:hypothetical protein
MRVRSAVIVISTLSFICVRTPASGVAGSPNALAALQAKADQAEPRDKCFLYAELVSQMTELAGQQFNSGDSVQASKTLDLIRRYADKIHIDVADDSRKLKNAESLIQHTASHLRDILHEASYEDRQDVEATLEQLNQVQTQLMMQVFKK